MCRIEPSPATLICSIELPINVPRSMFDRELDYYGIASAHGITEQESLAKTSQSFIELLGQAKTKHHAFFLAVEFHYQFCRYKVESNSDHCRIRVDEGDRLYNFAIESRNNKYLVLDDYLAKYFGLEIKEKYSWVGSLVLGNPSRLEFVICMVKG
jgi:hypothetical protein